MTTTTIRAAVLVGSLVVFASACKAAGSDAPPPVSVTAPPTPALRGDPSESSSAALTHLEQGWDAETRRWFYTAPQGSALLPAAWFWALEQPDSRAAFSDPDNMRRFGWLLEYGGREQNEGLPLGFVRSGEMLGLTCAACHTAQIDYEGHRIRIDGGPAMADVESFLEALAAAMGATLQDEGKLDRFARAVLGQRYTVATRDELRAELQRRYDERVAADETSRAPTRYGFARLDAFGRIFNRALRLVDPANGNPADAPVSYPVLWDTPQHDWVQWNGLASNAGTGSLERNVGQLIGVFGDVEVTPGDERGYRSSADVEALLRLEEEIATLRSPQWPQDVLGELDANKVEQGARIYARRCERCHALIDRADPDRRVVAQMQRLSTIGTDPTVARNIVRLGGRSGILKGQREYGATGQVLGERVLALQVVRNLIAGVLEHAAANGMDESIAALSRSAEPSPRQGNLESSSDDPLAPLLAYKARPLNGVWASAPYLHNGSVPTLYDMLLPAEQRPRTFWVGRRAFDPVHVGFSTEPFDGGFELDTSLPANANTGHEFAADLDEEARWALLEYLKSL